MDALPLKEEQGIYHEFIRTHPKSRLDYHGQTLEYIVCGNGPHTLLMPPHISSLFPLEMGYRQILAFESQLKVIALSLIETNRLDEIAASLLYVLEKEASDPVILFGQSGSGITAQVFFRRYFQRVAGMILVNTVAPGHPAPRTPLFRLIKLIPSALLKLIFTRKLLKQIDTVNLPGELIPKLELSRTLLCETLKGRFSKRVLTIDLRNALQFNAEGFVDLGLFSAWPGRNLIITSEDDAGYEDSKTLSEKLPNASLLLLEKGYGHLAPLVKSQEMYQAVSQWVAELG
ncbi:MAG: alpha/beta hydrolase [Anaerolineales bacterium]|nr:alpha/beta hydrolase [Anaerolineales bacterium]